MVSLPEAEKFSSSIALAEAIDPLRATAAKAFSEFFLVAAREIYPRYGFAMMSDAEFGAATLLD